MVRSPWPPSLRSFNSQLLLFESSEYLVLSKPWDFHMDGTHCQSVHKLLTLYYPSEKLRREKCLEIAVSKLHKWNDLPDNELRPCHQLDYATSGVLLVARNKSAAQKACEKFRNRTTSKYYLAVVHGHLDQSKAPTIQSSTFEHHWGKNSDNTIENRYRRHKQKQERRSEFFPGYMPTHSVFVKWQSVIKQNSHLCNGSPFSERQLEQLGQMKWKQIAHHQSKETLEYFEELAKLFNASISQEISINNYKVTDDSHLQDILTAMLRISSKKRQRTPVAQETVPVLPTIFRMQQEEGCYIQAPIASVENQFRMAVHPDSLKDHSMAYQEHYLLSPSEYLDFKPALTKCTVLWKGHFQQQPVTKVLLQPQTGRRHQLRLHMVVLGHPIVGDATYEYDKPANQRSRMCLHAHQLHIPLEINDKSTTSNNVFEAPDPFPIIDDQICIQTDDW